MDQKQHREALDAYNRGEYRLAAELLDGCADHVDALVLLGICLAREQDFPAAFTAFAQALRLEPDSLLALFNRGVVYEQCARWEDAAADYRRVLELKPGHTGAANNLTNILKVHGRLDDAEDVCREALRHAPDNTELLISLGNVMAAAGEIGESLEFFRRAMTVSPKTFIARSNFLLDMNYLPLPPEEVFREHRAWNRVFMECKHPEPLTFPPRQGGRIKVGYFSPDFRLHSVAYFIEPVLRAHDRSRFEIHAFSDVRKPDEVTRRLAENVDAWHDVSAMNADAATEYIRRAGVDILVDLAGHTGRKLPVFARRGAPVQVAYLGYPNTTGLRNMDYRFADDLADPPGSERLYTEKLLYLPGGMWSYAPLDAAPELADPPCLKNGYLTFGSFNNIAKISDLTVACWAAAMRSCPESRLLLKNRAFAETRVCRNMTAKFTAHGIAADRLELCGFEPDMAGHLEIYNRIDLALDTLPYNGTTTTFEALWMGVPVLSMTGNTHAGRVGKAILSRLGFSAFVAADPVDFAHIAAMHAANPEALTRLRPVFRHILADSPLLDGARLAREMEKHYMTIYNTIRN